MEVAGAEDFLRRYAEGGRDFQGANLSGANLRGARLKGANLRGANLRGATLLGADLSEARLVRADLGMADLGMTDFSGADLNAADFRATNLKGANFKGASMNSANLRGAHLHGADLRASSLVRADLSRADLGAADIRDADLRGADLRGVSLHGAALNGASLQNATLQGADLRGADLRGALLLGANLTAARLAATLFGGAAVGGTVFGDLDLREARGLETLQHAAPSTVGTDTLRRSLGQISEDFLRGCGFAPWEILAGLDSNPHLSLVQSADLQRRAREARDALGRQRRRVFILHSEADAPFVEALRRRFLDRGVFSWVAAHEKRGSLRAHQSKLAIQHDLALILVLSQNSLQSDWVEHEERMARNLEASLGERILSLVSVDHAWKSASGLSKMADKLTLDQVLSFAGWEENEAMEEAFALLLARLALFHPPVEA